MKRGGPTHPKTYTLAELLGVRRAHAVGVLELLFHFAAQYAPEGDVGRYSDKRIAAALDWAGSPGKLVTALVEAEWLDIHPVYRLVVHGWDQHADRTTLQKLSRAGKKPIQLDHADTRKVCPRPETAGITPCALPEPEPEPEPIPEPEPAKTRASIHPIRKDHADGGISEGTWDRFMNRYADSGKPLNEANWVKAGMEAASLNLGESDMTERVMPALEAELLDWSDRNVGMIPYPANWLKSKPWTRTAKPREAPLTALERKQRAIDREWEGLGNGTR